MRAILLIRRVASWLALGAMALNASWPLLAGARPALPSDICSANGLTHAGSDAPSHVPDECARHCALCSLTGERGTAMPSRASALRNPTLLQSRPPVAVQDTPRLRNPYRLSAPSRAPPAFS